VMSECGIGKREIGALAAQRSGQVVINDYNNR